MLEWLVPIALFWIVGAVYLGGFPVEFEGDSGLRQTLGLLATFAAFLVTWVVLRAALGAAVPGFIGGMLVPIAITIFLFPWLARFGFRAAGVRITRAERGAH